MSGDFENNQSFLEYLKEMALASKDPKRMQQIIEGPHPSKEMLYDYVLNWADKKVESYVMEHIASCPQCSQEILDIMEIEGDLDEELLKYADNLNAYQKLLELVTSISLPVYSYHYDTVVTRSDCRDKKINYYIGDTIVLSIPIDRDGYVFILHYDPNSDPVLIFPSSNSDDNSVKGGEEKKITGKITGPTGYQGFKVIWTSKNLLDLKNIDFKNKDSIESALNQFADKLLELNENEWIETIFEYEVSE